MVRDYQCWPDADGKHAWLRHKCRNGYDLMMIPEGPWHFDGQQVAPSINCGDCGFHMFVQKTHQTDPEPTPPATPTAPKG